MGSLFKKRIWDRTLKQQGAESPIYWISFYDANGKRHRESAETTERKVAERLLKEREGRVARGEPTIIRQDRVTYEEIRNELLIYYTVHGTRNVTEAKGRLAHLDPYFGGWKVVAIRPAEIEGYAKARQDAGAANATINRETATLSKMLHLAVKHGKLSRAPVIDGLEEADPRAGFVTDEQFASISRHLPLGLQAPLFLAFVLGWRKQEVLGLQRRQLDLVADGTVRLDPGKTKNREGRLAYLPADLRAAMVAQDARVEALEHQLGRIIPWAFPYLDGWRAGERQLDPRKAWATACKAAGLPGILIHDLRRSAVRNMERHGLSRTAAMKITGHKTEAVYRRYAINSDSDLREAAAKMGTSAGTFQVPGAKKSISSIGSVR